MKKSVGFVVACSLLFFASQLPAGEKHHLTILHFNDIHGYLTPPSKGKLSKGGAARIAAEIKKIEKENDARGTATLVLFGGDAFTGGIVSRAFKGQAEMDFLNALKPDAMVIGNHEFDFGRKILEARMKDAKFPVLSANTAKKTGGGFAKDMIFVETKDGVKVGIIGLSYSGKAIPLKKSDYEGLEFIDSIKTAKRGWKTLSENSDVQIALTHIGVSPDIRLAKTLPGIDAVIGGHDHVRPEDYCRDVGVTPVCQTPANGLYLGRVDMDIEDGKVIDSETKLIPMDATIKPDKTIAKIVDGYDRKAALKYDAVIGTAPEGLSHKRDAESPLGDLVTDVMRERTGADVAITNSAGIRRPMSKGPIKLKDVYEILPFDNDVVTVTTDGADLRKMLGFAATSPGGTRLQVSGMKFRIAGRKIVDVEVGGQPLDETKIYTVATIDFLVDGGDRFVISKNAKTKPAGFKTNDAMADYIKKVKIIKAPPGGRIFL